MLVDIIRRPTIEINVKIIEKDGKLYESNVW